MLNPSQISFQEFSVFNAKMEYSIINVPPNTVQTIAGSNRCSPRWNTDQPRSQELRQRAYPLPSPITAAKALGYGNSSNDIRNITYLLFFLFPSLFMEFVVNSGDELRRLALFHDFITTKLADPLIWLTAFRLYKRHDTEITYRVHGITKLQRKQERLPLSAVSTTSPRNRTIFMSCFSLGLELSLEVTLIIKQNTIFSCSPINLPRK